MARNLTTHHPPSGFWVWDAPRGERDRRTVSEWPKPVNSCLPVFQTTRRSNVPKRWCHRTLNAALRNGLKAATR
jgi:hypothetical protein